MAKVGFYAVKVGRVPGVYTSWDDCKAQVDGFPNAAYQKFKSEEDANRFVYGEKEQEVAVEQTATSEVQPSVPEQSSKKASAYYAVRNGYVPGVYTSWKECQDQINGFPGAKYRKFGSEDDAKKFVDGVDIPKPEPKTNERNVSKTPDVNVPDGPYAFVDGSFNPDTGVYGFGGFVNVLGRKYPIYGSDCDPEMTSMRNVAGEISGAMAAVKKAESLHIRDLTILYDYRGIEEWATGNWKTNKQGTRDYAEFMNPDNRLVNVSFQKVPAHTGIEGNEMADVMAKNSVGIRLTGPQQQLLEKAMNCGKRDGLPDVGVSHDSDFGFDFGE